MRVAVVQAAPVLFDTPKTLQKLADLAADAARKGAELVVFPEAFVGGYPKGHDFGVSVGIRSPEGRDEFRRYFENAIEISGPGAELIGAVAKEDGRQDTRESRMTADTLLRGGDLIVQRRGIR